MYSLGHPFARDFRQRKTVFDAIVTGRWSVFGFHFLCMSSSVRMILSLLDYLVVQMKCPIFFVSYSSIVRSSLTYECRRPKFDVDANQKQEVLTLTPSCVAAVDVLLNGQALSTQAQRIALIHFAICPPLTCYYYINYVFARAGRALFQVRFFQVPTLMPFPTQTCFTTGQYSPNFVS